MVVKIQYIIIASMLIVWAVIPFRQYGKKYFYYFYFTSICDFLTLHLRFLFHSDSNFFYMPTAILMLIFVQSTSSIKKYKLIYSIILIVLSLLSFILTQDEFIILYGVIHLFILITLSKDLIRIYVSEKVISIFITILVLDENITILKFLGVISGASNNYYYFYASSAFEILIGLFFWIKEDNPKLLIQLK